MGREDDLSNKEQSVTFKTPQKPEEKQPAKKETPVALELPKTGSTQSILWGVIGFLLMVFVGLVWLKHSKKQ